MIYIDFDSINGKFMKFVCEHSSFVSFLIPAKTTEPSFAVLNSRLKEWEPYLLRSYCDMIYLDSEFGEEYRILLYEMNEKIKEKLICNNGLGEWRYPKWPEDPCFFDENEACWFKTVIHEELAIIYDESELAIEEIEACGIDFDVWEIEESNMPRLKDPENVKQRTAERRQRETEPELRTVRYKESVAPILRRKDFCACGDTFYRLIDNLVLLLVEIRDENIYFDTIPLCIGTDPGLRFPVGTFDVRSLLESKFVEDPSESLIIDTFIKDVFVRMCKVKDLKDACEFHQFYLKQTEDETLDEILIYAALWLERYELALELIKKTCAETITSFEEDYEGGHISLKEMENFKAYLDNSKCGKLARLLNTHSCDSVRERLEMNRRQNLKTIYKQIFGKPN